MVNNNMQYINNHNSNNNIDMAQVNVLVANCIMPPFAIHCSTV